MRYAVYYKNRKLTPPQLTRELAEEDLKRLIYCFKNITVKQVMR